MRTSSTAFVVVAGIILAACTAGPSPVTGAPARDQVLAAERAFADTMARRDLAAFATFVDDEAVFFSGPKALRGKRQVIESWAKFFSAPEAPFSWEPDQVEVLGSGTLALSTGPVRDPSGKPVARFNSIWRQSSPGVWTVVFDKGSPLEPAAPH